jgi:adenine-specific DNA-methyltransferase
MSEKNDFLTKKVITYLGNKRKLLDFINKQVAAVIDSDEVLKEKKKSEIEVFDIFSGSGVVSRSLKSAGYKVLSNDLELYSIAINKAFIGTNKSDLNIIFEKNDIPKRLFNFYKNNSIETNLKLLEGKGEVEEVSLECFDSIIDVENSIKENGSYLTTLFLLNNVRTLKESMLEEGVSKKSYFQSTYAPADTENPDFENERLFYTQENAQFLDAVLDALFLFEDEKGLIFGEYDLGDLNSLQVGDEERSKEALPNQFSKEVSPVDILLAEIFSLMTTNINTSGTMKGYHNGWGGKGGNALKRILGHMVLTGLPLIDSTEEKEIVRGENYNDFAELIFKEGRNGLHDKKVDVIYADPPYNQHQYSANYHMLTTAIKNRDYDAGLVEKGSRAGIRKTHTRSDFSKGRLEKIKGFEKKVSFAYVAFDEFVKNIQNHTKYLLVSYNQEGVLSQDELIEVMAQDGSNKVDFVVQKHEKYKGGKNTNTSNYVVEYLFVVTMNKEQTKEEVQEVKRRLQNETRMQLILDKCMKPETFEYKEYSGDLGYKVWFDKENDSFLILNKELKVIEDRLKDHSDETLALIEEKMFDDLDPISLMDRYLHLDQGCEEYDSYLNIEAALKLLMKFKIKKYEEDKERYFSIIPEKIESLDFSDFAYLINPEETTSDEIEVFIQKEKERLQVKFEKIKSKM